VRVAFLEPLDQRHTIPDAFLARHEVVQAPAPGEETPGLAEAEAVVWSRWPVDRTLIDSVPRLRYMQRNGVFRAKGDASAALERGIPVSVMPQPTSARVAEHTFALILGLTRGLLRSHAAVVEGLNPAAFAPEERLGSTPTVNWAQVPGLVSLQFKTVGIIGFGEIGACLAAMLQPFRCRVLYNKRTPLRPEQERFYGVEYAGLDEALARSDVVVDLVPVSDATRSLFGEREFGLMKPTACIVNSGRGPSIDEEALVRALTQGTIAGAGLDVFCLEPLPPGHPLTKLSNVLLTPHTAGGTPQGAPNGLAGWQDMFERLGENLRRVEAGLPIFNPLRPGDPQP
jgi:phosphoglycerate dehydrogenase-like enzyme